MFRNRELYYETLIRAIKSIRVKVLIAPAGHAIDKGIIPDNVVLMGVVDGKEYFSTIAKSKLLVLSLEPDISRGQGVSTYVAAMRLGKTVIVDETSGSRSYIENGRTGLGATQRPGSFKK
jgi:glycosyltransferase involved in cell wall biosynthesis